METENSKTTPKQEPSAVIRTIDSVRRIGIPAEICNALRISPGDKFEFRVKSQNEFILRRYDLQKNQMTDLAETFVPVIAEAIKLPVAICDMQHILADVGMWRSFAKMEISPDLIGLIEDMEPGVYPVEPCPIMQDESQTTSYIAPIVSGQNYGAILVLDNGIKPEKSSLLIMKTVAQLIAEQMQKTLEREG